VIEPDDGDAPADARADGLGLWLLDDPDPWPHEIARSVVAASAASFRIRATQL
jgi:hypothetical protein